MEGKGWARDIGLGLGLCTVSLEHVDSFVPPCLCVGTD